ncbi:serine/threonine protein kinase [Corallococcus sp. H22C18031201]|nr:serine/threonine protein kinase [Corallococcus sp. H22C18031201]
MSSPQTAIPFGKYLLIKRLAVGGMAELFLAQEPPNPELVVLKRILPYLSEEPEFVQMFLDEARIAAQLHHPNIVQVHELGKLGENIFIAMEYVEGVDLRRVMAEESKFGTAIPYGVAARICAQVAGGLDYAHHSRGVDGRPLELIHRDVSPQNVMIAYDGRVKLVDFGIAKAGAFMERSKPGVIKGKFLYLAPEQVMQERLDHRADIFALGSMLYEISTGRQPFAKPTTEGILYAIRYEDPSPPHLMRPDYPEVLSRIVMRCLTKDRAQRYQRAADVQADLDAFLASGTLRQSTDVADYISRLLGEEEERTILHIPVAAPAGRKDATVPLSAPRATPPISAEPTAPVSRPSPTAPPPRPPVATATPTPGARASSTTVPLPPAGLTARPVPRRPTHETLSAPDYDSEPEPATQMARPRDLPTADPGDDDEESTAVRTVPLTVPASDDAEDDGDGEFTVPLRKRPRIEDVPTRPMPGPGRRSLTPDERPGPPVPARVLESPVGQARATPEALRPRRATNPASPLAAPPRRASEDEDDGSGTLSLTQPVQRPSAHRDEARTQDSAITPPPAPTPSPRASRPTTPPRPAPLDEPSLPTGVSLSGATDPDSFAGTALDDDDDESTVGSSEAFARRSEDDEERDTLAQPASRSRGMLGVVLLVGGGMLFFLLAAGIFWALNSPASSEPEPLPPEVGQATAIVPRGAEPRPAPEVASPPVDSAPATSEGLDAGVSDAGSIPTAESPPAAVVAPDSVDAGVPTPQVAATPIATEAKVLFEAPAKTILSRPGGARLPLNKVLTLPTGPLRVSFDCPGRRAPRGTETYVIRPDSGEAQVLKISCKARR